MDVQYPGFGTITVEGVRYDHDVVIDHGEVRKRDKKPSKARKGGGHTPLTAAEDIPWSGNRLIIGSGYSGSLPVLDEVREAASAHGVEVVVMPTAEACTVLWDLAPTEVTAILHVTC